MRIASIETYIAGNRRRSLRDRRRHVELLRQNGRIGDPQVEGVDPRNGSVSSGGHRPTCDCGISSARPATNPGPAQPRPIATGESLSSKQRFAELQHNVVSILQPEPLNLGGIYTARKIDDEFNEPWEKLIVTNPAEVVDGWRSSSTLISRRT